MTLRSLRFVVVAVVVSGCGIAGPTTSISGSREADLDLRGTTWLVTRINAVLAPPSLEAWLEIAGEAVAAGSGACGPFHGTAAFEDGVAEIDFETDRFVPCPGRDAGYRLAFLEGLASTTTYLVADDELLLRGTADIALRRAAPSAGEARQLWELLRGEWRVARATVDVDVSLVPPVLFRDRSVVAPHDCGFQGRWAVLDDASIRFAELIWELDVCADPGGRLRLVRLLGAATEVAVVDDRTVSISGPGGEAVLERVAD